MQNAKAQEQGSALAHCPTGLAASRPGERFVVELDSRRREVFRRLDYAVWRLTAPQPVRMLRGAVGGDARARGVKSHSMAVCTIAHWRDSMQPERPTTRGARVTARSSAANRSPTSRRSSRCTNRCRSAGGLGVLRAITARVERPRLLPLIGVRFMLSAGTSATRR